MASTVQSKEIEIQQVSALLDLANLLHFPATQKLAQEVSRLLNPAQTHVHHLTPEELRQKFQNVTNFIKSEAFIQENGLYNFLHQNPKILSLQVLQMLYDDYLVHDHKDFEKALGSRLNQAKERRGEVNSDCESRDKQMLYLLDDLYSPKSKGTNAEPRTTNEIPTVKIEYNNEHFKIFYKGSMLVNESKSLYETILLTYYFVIAFSLPFPMAKLFNAFDKLVEKQTSSSHQV